MSRNDHEHAFKLVAGHPALDLVNTLDWRFRANGTEELLASSDDFLRFVAESEILTPRQIRQIVRQSTDAAAADALVACRELREAAAEVLYAAVDGVAPPHPPVKVLERFFKESREHQCLAWDKYRLRWEWLASASGPALPLWVLALGIARLLVSEDMHRLRACENPECRWLFLDTSKNRTRRWCDMKLCGNRMKARRFKAQHKD
jgi:predicted RNA-binding Zn ribbon-like protein